MAEELVSLPDVSRLSSRVIRILGRNAGKFTLQGTNTYLISSPSKVNGSDSLPTVLVDVAEGKSGYWDLLRNVLTGQHQASGAKRRHITHILLTHWHQDHVGGLPSVLAGLSELRSQSAIDGPPPILCKFRNDEQDVRIAEMIGSLKPGKDFSLPPSDGDRSSQSSIPFHYLRDSQTLAAGDESSIQVHHTPGHTKDHLSLFLPQESVFFSGDNVLGQGTSVFEDLSAYLDSLHRSLDIARQHPTQSCPIYPAHGPVIEKGPDAIQTYIDHRLQRERQIIDLLKKASPSGTEDGGSRSPVWTIMDVVKALYASYPEALYPAAARGIFLHLHKLGIQGHVCCTGHDDAGPQGQPPPVDALKAEYMEGMGWFLLDKGKL